MLMSIYGMLEDLHLALYVANQKGHKDTVKMLLDIKDQCTECSKRLM